MQRGRGGIITFLIRFRVVLTLAREGCPVTRPPDRERKRLEQANHQIAQLKNQISHQLQIIQRLQVKGKRREDAAAMLSTLEDTLRLVERHRALILERLQETK